MEIKDKTISELRRRKVEAMIELGQCCSDLRFLQIPDDLVRLELKGIILKLEHYVLGKIREIDLKLNTDASTKSK